MSHDDQIPFEHPELVVNPEPRCACLLLLDTSGSMHGQPITELNAGLTAFKEDSWPTRWPYSGLRSG
jgi:hypothetical protein